jgi:prepilin-type processing-associated H-X9-DG protein
MYADDQDSQLPPNFGALDQTKAWVKGWLDFTPDNTDNTNLVYLETGHLWPYSKSAGIYKCPADHSRAKIRGRLQSRVRSVSMNGWVGKPNSAQVWPNQGNTAFMVFNRLSEMSVPAGIWVILDEREDSIDDSYLGVDMVRSVFANWPASYHNGACGFAFADGHAEIKSWKDPRSKPRIRPGQVPVSPVMPNNPDIKWLQERTTVRR